jgi:hypothetical protein
MHAFHPLETSGQPHTIHLSDEPRGERLVGSCLESAQDTFLLREMYAGELSAM